MLGEKQETDATQASCSDSTYRTNTENFLKNFSDYKRGRRWDHHIGIYPVSTVLGRVARDVMTSVTMEMIIRLCFPADDEMKYLCDD